MLVSYESENTKSTLLIPATEKFVIIPLDKIPFGIKMV
jgi:hypothetical protein